MRKKRFQRTRKYSQATILLQYTNELCRAGGVIIYNSTGKIDVNNTFEERLHLLETDALPAVRATLFGENKNRKFRD